MNRFNTTIRCSLKLFFSLVILLSITPNQRLHAQIVLYGVSAGGGADSLGCIYKINSDGSGFDTLYSFQTASGYLPLVVRMAYYNGKFYGTTTGGGSSDSGVLFSFDPVAKAYNDILNFDGANGKTPNGGVTVSGGVLYGLTSSGGAHDLGLLYSYNPVSNVYHDIFDFDSVHGSTPYGELTLASNGNLYGGTLAGGQYNRGVVFSLTPPSNFQVILNFDSVKGWEVPFGPSITDAGNGKLYGVTVEGGSSNLGVIFTLGLANNSYEKVFDFDSVHGAEPFTGMTLGPDGNLYGATVYGGANDNGVLYKVTTSNNAITKLHDFSSINDGTESVSPLLKGTDGNIYGTAYQGGANNEGTIFSYTISDSTFNKIHDCTQIDYEPTGALVQAVATGISDPEMKQDVITISPNPVADVAMVHFISGNEGNYNLTLSDITGKILMQQQNVMPTGNGTLPLNLNNFSAGIYFLSIGTDGNLLQSLKVVKQ